MIKNASYPEKNSSTIDPFITIGLKTFSENDLDHSIRLSRNAAECYDPETQTSPIPVYAGTAKTYSGTTSWEPGPVRDDEKVSDY